VLQLPREIETRMARVMERDAVDRWWQSVVPLLDGRTPEAVWAAGDRDEVRRVIAGLESPGVI
jgi:hypothetical protein